jgi:hypothetical protein
MVGLASGYGGLLGMATLGLFASATFDGRSATGDQSDTPDTTRRRRSPNPTIGWRTTFLRPARTRQSACHGAVFRAVQQSGMGLADQAGLIWYTKAATMPMAGYDRAAVLRALTALR